MAVYDSIKTAGTLVRIAEAPIWVSAPEQEDYSDMSDTDDRPNIDDEPDTDNDDQNGDDEGDGNGPSGDEPQA
ncbi:MAG: hypothetical protein JO024_07205 [Candidatus Eremiobacteraeota bacterium]|nr:hypothetical protein [Candidatus Eremiobacteraeota bacterium]